MQFPYDKLARKLIGRPKINYAHYTSNINLVILLVLLSCALLLDMSVGKWIIMPPSVMIVFILLCLLYINLFKYWWASIGILIILLLAFGRQFPQLANHGNLEMFVCGAIIIFFLRKIITGKGVAADTITRCFRYSLITIYFIAGFHKLNSGFFEIDGSCSTYVIQGPNLFLFGSHAVYPDIVVRFLQISTIIIEMVVPFGILFHRTRKVTAWMLVIFHFYLSFCGFSNFSAFAAFLIAGCILDLKQQPTLQLLRTIKIYILITIVASLSAYVMRKFGLGTRQITLMVNGIIYNIGLIYLFYHLLKIKPQNSVLNRDAILPGFIVILISIWGLQGYLGLSNTSTLTMFSNLVTEKTRSNHFIVNTNYTKIWDFEEDYITIVQLPYQQVEWGRKYKIEDYDVPLTEFKKIAKGWVSEVKSKQKCVLLYKGEEIEIEDLAKSEFSKPKWWHRFLYYRRIPKNGVNQCMW